MQVEIDRRKALKVERDTLFARYLTQPRNIRLAVEIKAIDDEIAKSVEDSSSVPQRSRIPAPLRQIRTVSASQDG
jgi:hypothetical protein